MTKKKRLRKERRRSKREAAALDSKGALGGQEYVYIIGIGSPEDWEADRGSLFYIEDKNGETVLPIWTTPEGLQKFARADFGTIEAYMQMLESLGANVETHAAPIRDEVRYTVMPVNYDGLALAAARTDADYLIRDPRPGAQQETMRLPKQDSAPET